MNTRIFFIFLVALCCIFLTLGREIGYSFNSKRKNDIEVNNFDLENFCFDCMDGLNRTYIKLLMDTQMKKCCAETLNDSYNIWFLTFHYCIGTLLTTDFQHCFNKIKLITEDQNFKTPRPKTAEECDESFLQSYDNAFKEQCKFNTNKNLEPVCKAFREEKKSLL
ncbi:uncharacterized protein LOC111623317 isoform X2 [Centruroides sculpturatus]|uniref:uncharacterized protein LOC111623317 isoform X2 n=1 Tax=Centruroides sculpturatus TaxID=218467 RepID=UPI000C6E220C|nr:uncharacterized protein LOC111623317 isoform X2 [Centruroides sculpturatus]